MVKCSTCKKEVNDIRPQIEGVGICFNCSDKPMTQEAMDKWVKHNLGKELSSKRE